LKSYDLIVGTHTQSVKECARLVMELLANLKKPHTAFETLVANPDKWQNATRQSEMM